MEEFYGMKEFFDLADRAGGNVIQDIGKYATRLAC